MSRPGYTDNSNLQDRPSVSVVLPTFNRAAALPRAIDSVLKQGFSLELIVVDDGSTDGSADVVKRYGDTLKYVPQTNAGPSVARNTGLDLARGQFVAFLDSDDEWGDGSLRQRIDLLQGFPEIDLVFSDFANVEGSSHTTHFKSRPTYPNLRGAPLGNDAFRLVDSLGAVISDILVQTSTVVVRRSAVGDTRFDASLRYGEDWDFWIRLAVHSAFAYIDRPLVRRHLEGANLSQAHELAAPSECRMWQGLSDLALSRAHAAMVRARLAGAHFDQGYALERNAEFGRATAHYARAFRLGPNTRRAAVLLRCLARQLAKRRMRHHDVRRAH